MTDTLQLTSLVRTARPAEAAAQAARDLVAVVAEWPAGSALEITFAPARASRVRVHLCRRGAPHPGWREDVAWALSRVASLRAASPVAEPDVRSVLEVRPAVLEMLEPASGTAPSPYSCGDGTVSFTGDHAPAGRTWPTPGLVEAAEILRAVSGGSVAYRIHLAPSSTVERAMVHDAVACTWAGPPADVSAYVGRTVRMRALLAGVRGEVPPFAKVAARRLADHLELVTTGADAWTATPDSLAGYAVPVGLAHALVPLPAAGAAPVPGLPTESPPLKVVALHPVPPPPAASLRLGSAWTATEGRTSASLGAEDLLHHLAVVGGAGTGKTTLVVTLALELLRRRVHFTVLDPRGTAARAIVERAPREAADRLRLVRYAGQDGLDAPDGAVVSVTTSDEPGADDGAHRLDADRPGARHAGAHHPGSSWLDRHVEALRSGTTPARPHVILVDDAHVLEPGPLARLLAEGRARGLGVVIVASDLGLDGGLAEAMKSAGSSVILRRSAANDHAPNLVPPVRWPAGDLTRLPRLHGVATLSRGDAVVGPFTLVLDLWSRPASKGRERGNPSEARTPRTQPQVTGRE